MVWEILANPIGQQRNEFLTHKYKRRIGKNIQKILAFLSKHAIMKKLLVKFS
jgi:hypothetical protein